MTEKKLPGAEPVYMVYDGRDRLILTQDGNMRRNTSGTDLKKWLYTKYDEFNRPVVTGIYTHSTMVDQAGMTSVVNNSGATLNESRTSLNYSTQYGYTITSFPTGSPEILTVTYYDDYNFDNSTDGGAERKFYNEGLSSVYNGTKKGMATGSKSRILDDNKFVEAATFYDKYGRTVQMLNIQPIDANNVDTLRISNQVNFSGQVIKTRTTNKIGSVVQVMQDEYILDNRGRLSEHKKTMNNEAPRVITRNTYNKLGQLVTEILGVTAENTLQNIDYLYNIRGWLRGVNNTPETSDLFAMQLFYNQNLTDLGTDVYYNGNISAMKWTHKDLNGMWKAYGFKYDKLNRLNDAVYGEYTSASATINSGYRGTEFKNNFNESGITYDLNGNIQTLNHRGIDNPSLSTPNYSDIDQLVYTYSGNKLIKVDDPVPDIIGRGDFTEKVNNATEYFYDANGNLYRDDNKGITNMVYNHLNLPAQVNFTASNDYIQYKYDANGAKLKKIVVKGSVTQYTHEFSEWFFIVHEQSSRRGRA
jgi:hypothetical protein